MAYFSLKRECKEYTFICILQVILCYKQNFNTLGGVSTG